MKKLAYQEVRLDDDLTPDQVSAELRQLWTQSTIGKCIVVLYRNEVLATITKRPRQAPMVRIERDMLDFVTLPWRRI